MDAKGAVQQCVKERLSWYQRATGLLAAHDSHGKSRLDQFPWCASPLLPPPILLFPMPRLLLPGPAPQLLSTLHPMKSHPFMTFLYTLVPQGEPLRAELL
jgi:hypothetical protein